ncbi:uncharacterized protein [Channa argus]|uniref:uncharacterized protein isoform X2 n=1 Tax=Channa argus TaxID=215402 RepID=UPI0035212EE3
MKVTVYSCWFFLVLGSNAAAEIIQKVFEEKQQISLPCPPPVDAKVTWSRETNGHKEDILTAHDGDKKHINDPDKRFSSLGDKSLYISRAAVSDSGTYFCNNKKAVELTVIPSAVILNATQRAVVTLKCSPDVGRSDPAWTREVKGKTKSVFGQGQDGQTEDHSRFVVSPVNQTLTITRVQPEDSGLYFCEEKPAAYVIVMDAASAQQFLWLLGVFLPLLLILTVLFLTWRHTIKRRGGEQRDTVYAEIADRPMFELQQGSSQPDEHIYSNVNKPCHHRKTEDVDGSTYYLLETPTAP